jgi:hypothetical protein
MDWVKKNYEKVLLGAVLLGLAVAVGFLPFMIKSQKDNLASLTSTLTHPSVKELTNLDLSLPEGTLKRASAAATINFGPPHKLFNPMPWQKDASGKLLPRDDQHKGPNAVVITKLTPLYLKLTLDNIQVADTNKYTVLVGIEKEAAPLARDRMKRQTSCSVGTKHDLFTLREVVLSPENSTTNIVIELNDGQRVTLSKEQPYRRVDGFMASLRYPPENKTWNDRRVNSTPLLSFDGEEYSIAGISQTEVVLQAKSNQKKWTVRYNPNSTATLEPR